MCKFSTLLGCFSCDSDDALNDNESVQRLRVQDEERRKNAKSLDMWRIGGRGGAAVPMD